MTASRINEEMAWLDGWVPNGAGYWHKDGDVAATVAECTDECGGIGGGYVPALPNYVDDLDAVALVVTKLTSDQWRYYRSHLLRICERDDTDPIDANAVQRCEAILRAVGRWEGP